MKYVVIEHNHTCTMSKVRMHICAIVFVNRVRFRAHLCNGSKSFEGCLKRRQRHFSEALNAGIDDVYARGTHNAHAYYFFFFMASLKIDSFLQYHKYHSKISSYINKVVSIKLALIAYKPCNSLVALKYLYRLGFFFSDVSSEKTEKKSTKTWDF